LVRCGYCGYALGASSPEKGRAPGRNYTERYVCGNLHCRKVAIATAPLDEAVWTLVRRVLTDPDIIAQEIARSKSDIVSTVESERAAIKRLLADVVAKQRNAAKAIVVLDDEEIAAPVRDELRLLGERRKGLEAELGVLAQRTASRLDDESRLVAFGEWAYRVSVNLDKLTYDERRMALEALAVSVDVFQVDDADHARWRVTMRPSVADASNVVSRYM
jgi:site-specific DNA recombinase